MTAIEAFIAPDGSLRQGQAHPETAELSRQILMRDLKKMKKCPIGRFVRRPYEDLEEVYLLRATGRVSGHVEAVLVFCLERNVTNARIPLTKEELEKRLKERDCADLYSPKETKGFG